MRALRIAVVATALAAGLVASSLAAPVSPLKVEVSLREVPRLNQAIEVECKVSSARELEHVRAEIILPEGAQQVGGDLVWEGALTGGDAAVFSARVAIAEEGNWTMKAVAVCEVDSGTTWSDVGYIDFSVYGSGGRLGFDTGVEPTKLEAIGTAPAGATPVEVGVDSGTLSSGSEAVEPPVTEVLTDETSCVGTLGGSPAALGGLVIKGRWGFYDRQNRWTGACQYLVELRTGSGSHIEYAYTDAAGYFQFPTVSNPGSKGVKIRIYTYVGYSPYGHRLIVVRNGGDSLDDAYVCETPAYQYADGTRDVGTWTVASPSADFRAKSFWIKDDIDRGFKYPPTQPGGCIVEWPDDDEGNSYYSHGGHVHIMRAHADDTPDVVLHEMGHNIMWHVYRHWMPDAENCNPHYITKVSSKGCAWVEGWADFYPLAVTGDGEYNFPGGGGISLEQPPRGMDYGDAVEGRVAGALLDIMDYAADGYDRSGQGFGPIWDVLSNWDNETNQRHRTFAWFWLGWRARGHNKCEAVASVYQNTIDYNGTPLIWWVLGSLDRSLCENGSLDNTIDLWDHALDAECPIQSLYFSIAGNTDPNCGVTIDGNRHIDINPVPGWYGTSDILIRVSDGLESRVSESFRVTVGKASVAVVVPNGGEQWFHGDRQMITWDPECILGDVGIDYSIDGSATWIEIAASAANDGSYRWAVPNVFSSACLVRVSDLDGDPTDVSNAEFTITGTYVASCMPHQNQLDAAASTDIRVIFDRAIDPTTITNSTVVANGSQSGWHQGSFSYLSDSNTVILDPMNDFAPGELVTVALSDGIRAEDGSPLPRGYAWSFNIRAGSGGGVFDSHTDYLAGEGPVALCAADLDGDEDIDLVTANSASANITVLLNRGSGRFTPFAEYPMDGNPKSICASDLNRDGHVDLAVATQQDNSISVFFNSGDGRFGVQRAYDIRKPPSSVRPADFNADGIMDLAVGYERSRDVSILLGKGDGSFDPGRDYSAGRATEVVFPGDLDKDGDFDLVAGQSRRDRLSILLNKGDGRLDTESESDAGSDLQDVFAGDFDGDGDLDLATVSQKSGTLITLLNNGDAVFTAGESITSGGQGPVAVFTADLDGDSDLDLVVANETSDDVSILLNDGAAGFGPPTEYPVGDGLKSVLVADLDGNSMLDIAVVNRLSDNVSVLLSRDALPPEIACPVDRTLECGEDLDFGSATATDNCDPDPVITFEDEYASGTCANTYVVVRTWRATDDCGNSSECRQSLTVVDTTPPYFVSAGPADQTVECGQVPDRPKMRAEDGCDPDVDVDFDERRIVGACSASYTLVRTWRAADDCGNSTSYEQSLTIVDTTPPPFVSAGPADQTVECSQVPDPAEMSAEDNCDPDVEVQFGEERMGASYGSRYTLVRTWTATDDCGNSTSHEQSLTIVDTNPPYFVGECPADQTVECSQVPDPAEMSAEDDCDPDVEVQFSEERIDDSYSTSHTLVRTWTATDDCGNSTSCQQNLTIVDTNPPYFVGECPADQTVECSQVPDPPEMRAEDGCDPNVEVQFSEERVDGNYGTSYTLVRTWTARDDCGNSAGCEQILTVIDATPPRLTIGVFQNPYLTQYMDIYMIGSEALDASTVELSANGIALDARLVDAANSVWLADYKSEPPGGRITITGRAADEAGNEAATSGMLSSTLVLAGRGGTAESPDGRVAVKIAEGVPDRDTYVVAFRCDPGRTQPYMADLADNGAPAVLSATGQSPNRPSYYIGPPSILDNGGASLEFRYEQSDLGSGETPDQLYITREGAQALECFVDPHTQTVTAVTDHLGRFQLCVGRPATSTIADPSVLEVSSYPNPFATSTTLRLGISKSQRVKADVYDVSGRHIASLADRMMYPGRHEIFWDGRTAYGEPVPSGVYFVQVRHGHRTKTCKLTVVR